MKYWRKLITMYTAHGEGTQLVRERIGLRDEKYIKNSKKLSNNFHEMVLCCLSVDPKKSSNSSLIYIYYKIKVSDILIFFF